MRRTPPSIHRAKSSLQKKLQEGTILSWTVVHHPPEGFPSGPRTIGLIELEDGSRVTAPLIANCQFPIAIGQTVLPRLRLSQVTSEGLRSYDVSYEISSQKPVEAGFPGYILALTGPSGVGKTTISDLLSTKIHNYVERVPIVTTRPPKDGDIDEYIYLSAEEFLSLKSEGKLAAHTSIPSSNEKRWYGYRQSDIASIWTQGKMPVVITEMDLLQGLATSFGRRSILSFGLLPPGKSKRQMLSALLHRLRDRGRDTELQIEDRLKNAEADLAFFSERKELFDHMIVNEDLDAVIDILAGRVKEYAKA